VGVEVPPRLARRLVSPQERDRLERAQSLGVPVVGEQELAAPERLGLAQPQPIEDDPEHGGPRERPAVLREARRGVGMMVLHLEKGEPLDAGALSRELRRRIVWVTIDDERERPMLEEVCVEGEVLPILVERRRILEVPLVLREDGLPVGQQAERRLELGAVSEQRRCGLEAGGEPERPRRIPSRPTQDADAPADDAGHGVVDAVGDRSIVEEQVVGDRPKPFARLSCRRRSVARRRGYRSSSLPAGPCPGGQAREAGSSGA
jgi:hypothetical protein